jgi:NAD-dependent deacetylase
MKESLDRTAGIISDQIIGAEKVVVFTGAGISTESGIPDFRSPGGIWKKYNPADFTFDKFLSDSKTRRLSWQRFREMSLESIEPNDAHRALAELEKLGKLDCIITQNIDGLHQIAGNSEDRIIELHGTARQVRCLNCGKRWLREEAVKWLDSGIEEPLCDECGGLLKSATISFGQAMPVEETREAELRSRNCDLFIVIGSSLVVYPAAYMPLFALENNAKLIIINRDPTPMDERATVVVNESSGETMAKVVELVRSRSG